MVDFNLTFTKECKICKTLINIIKTNFIYLIFLFILIKSTASVVSSRGFICTFACQFKKIFRQQSLGRFLYTKLVYIYITFGHTFNIQRQYIHMKYKSCIHIVYRSVYVHYSGALDRI